MLLEVGGDFEIRYFKNLEGKKGAKLKLGWVKKKQSSILSEIGFYMLVFVARTIFMLLSCSDIGGLLFLF